MNEQPQDAGQQDQAEQGLAQQWYDDELRRILHRVWQNQSLTHPDFGMLCGALKIDIRDVT